MKLYFHPVSTTSRPILQFCADANIEFEPVVIDLMTGEHLEESYAAINPNCCVPVLDDDGWILTESSAILKYLADKFHSSAYPTELKQRAQVNELMDWFNSNFYRDYGYNLIYPQLFPHHQRESQAVNDATIAWGKEKSLQALQILNDVYLSNGKNYLCGDNATIADFFGAAIVTLGEWISVDLSAFPNVERWIQTMKQRPSWNIANEAHNGFVSSLEGKLFTALAS